MRNGNIKSRQNPRCFTAQCPEERRLRYVANVSWPRSGHHLLINLLNIYFGDRFGYCEFYSAQKEGVCCGSFPCTRAGEITMSKNHDFDGKSVLPEGVSLVVQYREPVASIVSDYDLYLSAGREDTREAFVDFATKRMKAYVTFYDRWISPGIPNRVRIDYAELTSKPAEALARVIALFTDEPVDAARLNHAISNVDIVHFTQGRLKAVGRGVSATRDVTFFRYFDWELFQRLREGSRYQPFLR